MRRYRTAMLAMLCAAPAVAQPCSPADLAEPFGVLDDADISAQIERVAQAEPAADVNADGAIDFFDMLPFLRDHDEGCPVGSPVVLRDDIGCNAITGVCDNPGLSDGGYAYQGNRGLPGGGAYFPIARVDFATAASINSVQVVFLYMSEWEPDNLTSVRIWRSEADLRNDPYCLDPSICSQFRFETPSSGPQIVGQSELFFSQYNHYVVGFDLLDAVQQTGDVFPSFSSGSTAYIAVVRNLNDTGIANYAEADAPNDPSDLHFWNDGGNDLFRLTSEWLGGVPPFQQFNGRLAFRVTGTTD